MTMQPDAMTRRDALRLCIGGAAAMTAATAADAQKLAEDQQLGMIFAEFGVRGTWASFTPDTGRMVVFDGKRASRRMIPASTFKIANSLIALEVAAIAHENEIIPYGGQPQPFKEWERDMSMRDAIKGSVVPIYQELARRIGLERFREFLARLDYGNREVGSVVDRFWLDGPLEISAVEQAQFVAKLAEGKLDLSRRSQAIVRDIMRLETLGDATLYAKTGWAQAVKPDVGWLTGWVEREGTVHAFSMNIDMMEAADAPKRLPLAKELLKAARAL